MKDEDAFSLSSDEMVVTVEEFSLLTVENGLRNSDLRPLAEHLRNGFLLSPDVAGMIADAIMGQSGAPCIISAVYPKDGRPREELHGRNVDVGMAYLREAQAAKRGHAKGIRYTIAKRFHVSEPTVRDAVAYTRQWLRRLEANE